MSRNVRVLFRIERFEQCGSGIATEVAPDLVDFVEDEDWVIGLGTSNALDDLSGQGADVGAAMAADFGLVVDAAERQPDELAAERARDGLTERGLADTRRSNEAKDRPLHVGLEPTHGKIIKNAIFYLLEVVVVCIENLLGFEDLDFLAGCFGPRQHGQPLDIIASDGE